MGAGLSSLQYPGWTKLINILASHFGVEPITEEDDYKLKAEELFKNDSTEYFAKLKEIFTQAPTELKESLLVAPKLPFEAYITTCYDPSIYVARKMNGDHRPRIQRYPEIHFSDCTSGSITFAHGAFGVSDAEENNGDRPIVLHQSSYDQAYGGAGGYPVLKEFFRNLFCDKDVLFLGHGMQPDEEFRRYMTSNPKRKKRIHLAPVNDPKFALHAKNNTVLTKHAYGVDLLLYDPINKHTHEGLTSILTNVHARIPIISELDFSNEEVFS